DFSDHGVGLIAAAEVINRHVGAGPGQAERAAATDTAGGAGHERFFAEEFHCNSIYAPHPNPSPPKRGRGALTNGALKARRTSLATGGRWPRFARLLPSPLPRSRARSG